MARSIVLRPRTAALIVALCGSGLVLACSDQASIQSVAPSRVPLPLEAIAVNSGGPENADVLNQGGAGVYAPGGAMVVRQPNGLRMSVTMPTPEPGSYVYAPERTDVGHPEVFTLWAFIFNYPDLCTPPACGADDLGVDAAAKGGAYNVSGHAASGGSLTLAGRIGVGDSPFPHPVITMAPLESPSTAEIHLAVAPHGALDPTRLPEDFRLPTGSPACGCWWVAIVE
jgi:hypothetical protein